MSSDRRKPLTPRFSLLLSTFTIIFAWVAWTLLAEKSSSVVRKFLSSEEEEEEASNESEEEKVTNESEKEVDAEKASIELDFSENSRRDYDLAKNGDTIHYDDETAIDEDDRSTVARCYGLLNDIDSRIGRIFLRVFGRKNPIRKNGTIDDEDNDDDDDDTAIVGSDDS